MSDYTSAVLYARPDAPGGKHGVAIGTWRDRINVEGFETAHDAYWWCVQTIYIDPLVSGRIPEPLRKWIHDKPVGELDDLPLFASAE